MSCLFYMNLNHYYFIILPKILLTLKPCFSIEKKLFVNVDFACKLYACAKTSILTCLAGMTHLHGKKSSRKDGIPHFQKQDFDYEKHPA